MPTSTKNSSPKTSEAPPTLALTAPAPVPYETGVRIQERLFEERRAERIPDTLLMLEHPAVITLGRRGREEGLLKSREALARIGIPVYRASRGGDITYHAPGQWVLYPVLHLGRRAGDARGYLHNLEEIAIRTAGEFGVPAFRRPGMSGAWTEAGKIAAIGFHLRHWITRHGMSFNVNPDLGGFRLIVPCGLHGEPVASLETLLGPACPSRAAVHGALQRHFESVCQRPLLPVRSAGELPGPLADLGPLLFPPSGSG